MIYTFDVELSQVDRGISGTYTWRTSRHPSETLARVWLRVLGLAWQYRDGADFGPSLSDPEAADALASAPSGELLLWLRVGKADPEKVRRVLNQNPHADVAVLFESPARLADFSLRAERLHLAAVDPPLLAALSSRDDRRCKLALTFSDDHVYIDRDGEPFDGPLTR